MGLRCALILMTIALLDVGAETNKTDAVSSTTDEWFTLTTLNGLTYSNCVLRRVEPDGISVKHQKGLAKLYFTELPDDLRDKYGYDPAKAKDYAANVRQQQAIYQRNQEGAREAARDAQVDADAKEARQKMLKLIASKAMKVDGTISQITEDGALIRGSTVPLQCQETVEMKGFMTCPH